MTRARAHTAPATAGAVPASLDAGAVKAYDRVSRFREKQTGVEISRAVSRQTADNNAAAEARGLPAPVHYVDDGISASRFATKARDGWADLLDAIRDTPTAYVIVWLLDRAIRQTRDLDDLLDACRLSGAKIIQSGTGTTIDPTDPDSVTLAKIAGVLAEAEIAKMSIRQRRAHKELAANGGWHGGARAFGYNAAMSEIVPAEADALRDAMRRVMDGESISSITRRWNAAGLRTTQGKEFRANNVGTMLRRRYFTGVREFEGNDVRGTWPAIVDPATHKAACRELDARRGKSSGFAGRKYALSGLLLCSTCGHPMGGRPTRLKSGPAYTCRNGQHTQAPVTAVDGYIREWVIRRLCRVDAAGVFVPEENREAAETRDAERGNLMARRDKDLPAAVALGEMTPAQVKETTRLINERLAALDAEAHADADARRRPSRVLRGLVGMPHAETAAEFDALPMDRQRAVIELLGTPVLRRAGRGGRQEFNPNRLRFVPARIDGEDSGN